MAKKQKIASIDVDDLKIERGDVGADELKKIREEKYKGGSKKMPSLTARTMADIMFKDPSKGQFINVEKLTADEKIRTVRTLRKELIRVAKMNNKEGLRVRVKDQGNKVIFFYDTKKEKGTAKKEKAAKTKK